VLRARRTQGARTQPSETGCRNSSAEAPNRRGARNLVGGPRVFVPSLLGGPSLGQRTSRPELGGHLRDMALVGCLPNKRPVSGRRWLTTVGTPAANRSGTSARLISASSSRPRSQSGASPGDKYVVFTITVINKTATNYEPRSFRATVQSANVEGNSVYDSANGIGGSPTTPVLPGRESKFKLAFGVADPKDLIVQVTPGYSYKPAIFTS